MTKQLKRYKSSFLFNKDICYLIGFYSEFLICCGMKKKIHCIRKNTSFITMNPEYLIFIVLIFIIKLKGK